MATLPPAATGVHPKYEITVGEGAGPVTMAELQKQQSTPGRSWTDLYAAPAAKPVEPPPAADSPLA